METDYDIKNRTWQRLVFSFATTTRMPFDEKTRWLLPIPSIFNAYNSTKNEVDSFEQRRSLLDTRLRSLSNFTSVHQFVFDVALVSTTTVCVCINSSSTCSTAQIRMGFTKSLLGAASSVIQSTAVSIKGA